MENKKLRIFVSTLVAAGIALLSFSAGFLVNKCSADGASASYRWALETIKSNYYFCDPDESFTETSLKAIAEKYLDRYSEYYTKEEYAEVMKSNGGSKSGIGISYSYVNGKGVFIAKVVGNSPAHKAGLRAGEWITGGSAESGSEVAFSSSESFKNFISSMPAGQKIKLYSSDGKSVYALAKANTYTASYTSFSTSSTGWAFGDAATSGLALYEDASLRLDYLPKGCGYLRLDQFYGTAAEEFFSLAEKFNASDCTSLVLDLRSNGGGYVSVMQEIAGSFADGKSTLAMLSRDKNGKEESFLCKKVGDEKKRIGKEVRMYVLANAGTASASEALIGALVCYGALDKKDVFLSDYSDEYIGWLYPDGKDVKNARTYGKGIMQTPFTNYATGEVLKLTTAKIFWPDETTSIHDTGLTTADGCTPVAAEWEWTKGDAELQAVAEIIKARQYSF